MGRPSLTEVRTVEILDAFERCVARYGLEGSSLERIAEDGDFSLISGAVSGRRLSVATQTAVAIAETGSVDHVALVDSGESELLLVAPLTEEQAVTAGEIVTVKAFGAEIADPV